MNKRTIYTLPKDTELTGTILAQLIEAHKNDIATFATLESYVDDNPKISRDLPNALLTIHNFAQYITSINAGYLLGNPVEYTANDKTNLDPIMDSYRSQAIDELDSDLETDCSMFGQAFENLFVDETSTLLSAKLSVYNTIVIYDTTFKHNKLYAVYYAPQFDSQGREIKDKYDVTIWDDTKVMSRTLDRGNLIEDDESTDVPHFFKEVPVVHYMNNKRLKGDYEPVISLIDAYNILQSDRVIDREKLVDAILAFYGSTLTPEDQQAIKDNRVIGMPKDAKAEYIVKNINESDTDVLRKTIAADIHKFSMTPDLTDDSFGNAPSGVSILYKLLAFEQNIKSKERQFEAGLKDRFRMYATVLTTQSKLTGGVDIKNIDIVFKRALPKNDLETSTMINNLEGVVDDETLIGQLSFVKDASEVVKKVAKEKADNIANNPIGSFGTDNFTKQVGVVDGTKS